jgi:hypothetical protein
MSITGFAHSRFLGTLADAGCWAFTLRVLVIHPPKETKTANRVDTRSGVARLLFELAMQGPLCIRCFEKRFGPLYYSNKGGTATQRLQSSCAYTIVGAIGLTVNSILCETPSLVTSIDTASFELLAGT